MLIATKLGLTPPQIEAAQEGTATDELDAAILAAVDELDIDSTLSDRTWTTLSAHLDEHQRMDLVFTIGAYITLAMAFNAFGVTLESDG
jgi:hypothetical protein